MQPLRSAFNKLPGDWLEPRAASFADAACVARQQVRTSV
eukprot:SAG11_NODE_31075_length_295_cov_0.780612_1_plen_38_part_10